MHDVEVAFTVDAFPKVDFISLKFIYATSEVSYRNLLFLIDIEFVVYIMW